MEQAVTQMSVSINTVLDELNALRLGNKQIDKILDIESSYSQFEFFKTNFLCFVDCFCCRTF